VTTSIGCPRCGDEAVEVLRSPLLNQRTIDCPSCGRFTRQLIDRQAEARARRQRARDETRYEAWVDRIALRPMTATHRSLPLTRELRAAWANVRRAKTAPAIARRGQVFVDLILATARDQDRLGPDGWQVKLVWRDGTLEERRHRGGYRTTPTVSLAPLGRGTLGMFRRGLRSGYDIRLDPAKATGPDRYDQLRKTLIHETMHALDAETGVPDAGHDYRWDRRLAVLETMFPPSAYGTRSR
jgi:hypothetical protein